MNKWFWNVSHVAFRSRRFSGMSPARNHRQANDRIEVSIATRARDVDLSPLEWLDIIIYENKLLIKNFSRSAPMDYQCIADNGIPPRDTRSRHLVPASKRLSSPLLSSGTTERDKGTSCLRQRKLKLACFQTQNAPVYYALNVTQLSESIEKVLRHLFPHKETRIIRWLLFQNVRRST